MKLVRGVLSRAGWLLVVIIVLLLGPAFTLDPMPIDLINQYQAPSFSHPLGTDGLGRDMAVRTLQGGRRTLIQTSLALGFTLITALGIRLSGFWLGLAWVRLVARTLAALPPFVLALVLLTVNGSGGVNLIAAVGLTQVAPFLLATLAAENRASQAGYVEAARACGAAPFWIWRHHIWPAMMPALAGQMGVTFAYAVLMAASLSFLGFAGDPGQPEWGGMLFQGRQALRTAPWVMLAPGLGILTLTLAVHHALGVLARQPGDRL